MKTLKILMTTLITAFVLTGCGGGSETASITTTNPSGTSGKLIIDNGRGTTNNQDTERVK